MGILKAYKDYRNRKQVLETLNSPYYMYTTKAVLDYDFVFDVAKIYSAWYNDHYFSVMSDDPKAEEKQEKYMNWMLNFTNNFNEAKERLADDLDTHIENIKNLFNKTFNFNLDKELFEDNFGLVYSYIMGKDDPMEPYKDNRVTITDYISLIEEREMLEDSYNLLRAFSQAMVAGKVRYDAEPFTDGHVCMIDLETFEDYYKEIETLVKETKLGDKVSDIKLNDAKASIEVFFGLPITIDRAKKLEMIQDVTGATQKELEKLLVDTLHENYAEYLSCLDYLKEYKSITMYDKILMRNCDFCGLILMPALLYAPQEVSEAFALLDSGRSVATINSKYYGDYMRLFYGLGVNEQEIQDHIQIIDDKGNKSVPAYKDIPKEQRDEIKKASNISNMSFGGEQPEKHGYSTR